MTENESPAPGRSLWEPLRVLLKIVLPIGVIAAGAGIYQYMMATAPEPRRMERGRQARLVDVVIARQADTVARVEAFGSVQPAREVTLSPQVAGEIVEIGGALEPGGVFAAGELVARIEPRDYELTLKERATAVVRMEAQRTMERASQSVALKEYETLGEVLNEEEKSLVLREPQLAAADAELQAARAMLDMARLDLERTRIVAPFDAQVMEKHVDVGTRVSVQSPIAHLVGTEIYWVELSLPQMDVAWVAMPENGAPGSRVILRQPKVWGPEATREGRVIRLLPGLASEGRMARVLVSVEDPLALREGNAGRPPLLLGQYLQAEIEGRPVPGAFAVERRLLRNNDSVWIMNGEDTLEIRPVDIAYRGLERVLVRGGLSDGERIVATNIASVAEGMELRTGSPAEEGGAVAADEAPAGAPGERS